MYFSFIKRPNLTTIAYRTFECNRLLPSFLSGLCSSQVLCQNDGYQDPNTCDTCICPEGFTGQFCDQVKTNTAGIIIITAKCLTPTIEYK